MWAVPPIDQPPAEHNDLYLTVEFQESIVSLYTNLLSLYCSKHYLFQVTPSITMMLPPAAPEPLPAPTPPPMLESGPVAYEEPAEDEENEEEAEETCISAMELIGGNGQYVTADCSRVTDNDNEVAHGSRVQWSRVS